MTIEDRVHRGAHHMDTYHPGWVERSNPTSLDMSTRGRDILAQSAITPLIPGVEPQDPFDEYVAQFGWENAVVHGFAVRDDESYEDLTAAWSDCLVRRQEVDRSLTRP